MTSTRRSSKPCARRLALRASKPLTECPCNRGPQLSARWPGRARLATVGCWTALTVSRGAFPRTSSRLLRAVPRGSSSHSPSQTPPGWRVVKKALWPPSLAERIQPQRGFVARQHREPQGAFVIGLGRKQVHLSCTEASPKQFHNCWVQAPVVCMRTSSREDVRCIVVFPRNMKSSDRVSVLGYP